MSRVELSSSQWRDLLKEVQLEIFCSVLKPRSNVRTRWFSNTDVMKRMMEIRSECAGVIEALSENVNRECRSGFIEDNTFLDREVEMIQFYLRILEKLETMSKKLSSETEPSLSMIIPEYLTFMGEMDEELEKIEKEYGDCDGENDITFTLITSEIVANDRNFQNYSLLEDNRISNKQK